jgi:hypothetical protein
MRDVVFGVVAILILVTAGSCGLPERLLGDPTPGEIRYAEAQADNAQAQADLAIAQAAARSIDAGTEALRKDTAAAHPLQALLDALIEILRIVAPLVVVLVFLLIAGAILVLLPRIDA